MNEQAKTHPVVAVVGGGPAGLIAAETLATAGARVTVYERMPTVGRKFLMAGRGGLNLTHSEPLDRFLPRYGAGLPMVRAAVEAFPPEALRAWAAGLGEETFVGTSGRVFPVSLKASPLLRALLARLAALGVTIATRHDWRGFDEGGHLVIRGPEGTDAAVAADAVVLALGGASWPRLGSDGGWRAPLAARGVAIAPFRAANSGFLVPWSAVFRERFAGAPLKTVRFSFGDATVRGEAVITETGIEGGAIYALSAALRDAIERAGEATLTVDLRPDHSAEAIARRLEAGRKGDAIGNRIRKATRLSPVAIGLLREATGAQLPHDPARLASLIKALPLRLTGLAPISRAISTAGGIEAAAIDPHFMLTALPGVFVAGEMLDWEAPTGGYLLQASFATGIAAAKGALAWLGGGEPGS